MLMKMYDTKSSNNTINKVLENEHEFDIKLTFALENYTA